MAALEAECFLALCRDEGDEVDAVLSKHWGQAMPGGPNTVGIPPALLLLLLLSAVPVVSVMMGLSAGVHCSPRAPGVVLSQACTGAV